MFDGSYVLHQTPRFVDLGLQMKITERQVDGGGNDNDPKTVKFFASTLKISFNRSLFENINAGIFTHLVFFASRNESLYPFTEEYFDDDILVDKVSNTSTGNIEVECKDVFESVNEDFTKMADSPSWYKIHEIDIAEIAKDSNVMIEQDIDMKNYYQDYATRETLSVDQFSHHELSADYAMNYNSRLILSNMSTKFADYRSPINAQLNYPFLPMIYTF